LEKVGHKRDSKCPCQPVASQFVLTAEERRVTLGPDARFTLGLRSACLHLYSHPRPTYLPVPLSASGFASEACHAFCHSFIVTYDRFTRFLCRSRANGRRRTFRNYLVDRSRNLLFPALSAEKPASHCKEISNCSDFCRVSSRV